MYITIVYLCNVKITNEKYIFATPDRNRKQFLNNHKVNLAPCVLEEDL